MRQRPIPSTGESIPAVGLGTWQTFDVGEAERDRAPLSEILQRFTQHGGRLVDSSPMYGRSETVVGDLAHALGIQERLFYATKVWTRGEEDGIAQMNRSMSRMRSDPMDLMQIHNLVDWQTHLRTLQRWKSDGRIRYTGITHYQVGAFDDLERILRSEELDFVQLNFSIATREAENRLLPLAADRGVGTIINRPYETGSLFRAVRGQTVPTWASEFDCESWGQFFLKYILSEPNVTCVIPATSNPEHLTDNMRAGYGRLPDQRARQRMVEFIRNL
jgi:diketogulonate reductase-like aldo/keto reductase